MGEFVLAAFTKIITFFGTRFTSAKDCVLS
jgi:hypothetical protein